MRKKYLSALLFGALLFASAGTFTSCKDYDDDIDNLQQQITSNSEAIKALQDKINSGKWITDVNSIAGGFKVSFSDGQSFEIVNGAAGEAGKDGTQITIGEDGFWYFDGEKSDYKAVQSEETAKVKTPYIEDGYWYFYNEDGVAEKSSYKALGAAYAVKANGGYNIVLPNETGTDYETVFVAGAAAAMTSITAYVPRTDNIMSEGEQTVAIKQYTFNPDANRTRWKNLTGKTITSNKVILSSATKIVARVNPVNVQATGIDFSLTNSKNQTLPGIVFKASEYKGYLTRADFGNGLYTLKMENLEVKDANAVTNNFKGILTSNSKSILYALNADNACRGEYKFATTITPSNFDDSNLKFKVNDTELNRGSGTVIGTQAYSLSAIGTATKVTVDSKATNKVQTTDMSQIYDMWLTAASEDVNLFDLKFDQDNHTFSVNADPDKLTKASFDLTVHILNCNGTYYSQPIVINVSDKMSASATYEKRTLTITTNAANNCFKADMATVLTSLGDNADAWKRKVASASVAFFADEACTSPATYVNASDAVVNIPASSNGITLSFLDANGNTTTTIKSAANMKFAVDNTTAPTYFVVDNVYYAKVTFAGDGGGELNSVVVPVEFNIPTVASLLTPEAALVDSQTGAINTYFNKAKDNSNSAGYILSSAFVTTTDLSPLTDVDIKFTDDKVGETGKKASQLATMGTNHFTSANKWALSKVVLRLLDVDGKKANGAPTELGYGEVLPIKVSAKTYANWAYQAEGADSYTFTVSLRSALYDGKVAPAEGTTISVSANAEQQVVITSDMIKGYDYNNNKYEVLPNKYDGDGKNHWTRDGIVDMTGVSVAAANTNLITSTEITAATKDSDKNTVNGTIVLKTSTLSNDTDAIINVSVTDIWGYTKTSPITVSIKMNN